MRKLILQMQVSLDGYSAATDGRSWMLWGFGEPWTWDEALQKYHTDLTASIDTVLLSRKMAEEGFIDHWKRVSKKTGNPQATFAGNVTRARKVVFTSTLEKSVWENTELAKGDHLKAEVNRLKKQPGKDMIVYGGISFVAALSKARLIDEYHLVVNPIILGSGGSVFATAAKRQELSLVSARSYDCGMAVLIYASN